MAIAELVKLVAAVGQLLEHSTAGLRMLSKMKGAPAILPALVKEMNLFRQILNTIQGDSAPDVVAILLKNILIHCQSPRRLRQAYYKATKGGTKYKR